jgi:hypothetical protein
MGAASTVPGPTGPAGNTVLYGASNPTAGTGVDGNFYINTTTNFIYGPKAAGAWPAGSSLIGPPGATGAPGLDGNTVLYGTSNPTAGQGVNGNFYINSSTNFIFGPKAGGAWPTGVSLVGPQGPQGPQGIPGAGSPSTVPPLMDGTATVGVSNNFSREDHVHPSDAAAMAVRFDTAQSLTAAQQTQARGNIYAAPFDALAYSGMQINGSMDVSQESGTGVVAISGGAGKYIVDGFGGIVIGSGAANGTQTPITSLPGFPNCISFVCSAVNSLAGSSDGQWLYQAIEGYRLSRLAFGTSSAQPVTIGFWVNPGASGTMGLALRGGSTTRSYVVDVPVTASGWQFKTVTIPGDVAGSWATGNSTGATLSFCFGAGSGRKASAANTWLAGDFVATAATSNFFAATGAAGTVYLTGVIVLPGIEVPSAARAPFIMRSYDHELSLCRRYLWRRNTSNSQPIGILEAYGATIAGGPLFGLHPDMRAAPTVTISSGSHFGVYTAGGGLLNSVSLPFGSSIDQVWLNTATFATGLTGGNAALFVGTVNGSWMQMDARL